ncbi:ABC transporter ATP-binding protein [Halococcus hamelinensis]|uniref:ABC transporter-like protein n=1 Tax=Halococcus hamelinensis 100A6 TaxID=1132509 RepID=M0M3K7_9EURY|nr:ABC transporter ATP-binding protein [Halococcus hamelinensis]EMA39194.1 ABC transporter-like protein [Halococcus hamelinensis 100A6]
MSEPEQARTVSAVATDVEPAGGPETDTPVASDPIVRIRGLTYTYAGSDEPAVRGIDFTVREGEIFGFLGPSGAGKSTTQKVLTGLLDGYEGSVRVFGEEVANHGGDYYERIGISAEAPNHYLKLTGRENLTLFASLYDREPRDPDELLELVGLADDADRPVSAYSKGMRMRLNFVRALLNHPDLLVLDEPTNGLDPGNAKTVKDVVRELRASGTTVFVTTHDMNVADQLCDRVAFMVDGELPVVDSPKALKVRHGKRTVRVEVSRDGSQTDSLEPLTFPLDGLAEDPEFQRLLASGAVETLHTEEATLEDVFLDVTGEQLR